MRILYYGESPFHATGFAQVNKHILEGLSEVAEVTLVATSHYMTDLPELPYKLLGCQDKDGSDMRNLATIFPEIERGEWDLFFYQGDIGANNDVLDKVVEWTQRDPTKHSIFYMPVDCDVAMPAAFNYQALATVPVVYTEHARRRIEHYNPELGKLISVIGLGTEPEVFYPIDKREARLRIFGESYADRWLAVNVNRNQERKDLARCMGAWHLFHERNPDSTLYMHSVQNDIGGSLPTQAALAGCNILKQPPEIAFSMLDLSRPWSREQLNDLYNACDCLVSTSLGEGWGLATTEAMCAGIPVVVPENTANLDILGPKKPRSATLSWDRQRGWAIKTGGDLDHQVFTYASGGSPHDIIHAKSFVFLLEYIRNHQREVEEKCITARQWCHENTWQHKNEQWKQLVRTLSATDSVLTR